jgi:hypothetical protein
MTSPEIPLNLLEDSHRLDLFFGPWSRARSGRCVRVGWLLCINSDVNVRLPQLIVLVSL